MKKYVAATSDMKKYRITFTGSSVRDYEIIVDAHNSEEAFDIAYSMNMRHKGYDNVWVSEETAEPDQYGLEVRITTDPDRCKSYFVNTTDTEYVFITANNEQEARNYYNRYLYGNWCDNKLQLDPNGYRKFGKIIRSYRTFGGFKNSHYDATTG